MTAAQITKLLSLGTFILLMSGLGLLTNGFTPAAKADTNLPDTTPPAPVAGLVAEDGRDGKVKLGWNAAMEADFAYYAVYSSNEFFLTVAGKTAQIKLAGNASNNFTVFGLSDGVQYFFAVTAVDTGGNENRTVIGVPATPTPSRVPDTTAPPAVSGVSASDAKDGRVNLTWLPQNVTDFGHYSIYVSTQERASLENLSPALKLADMATKMITLTGLSDSTTYYFAVTAVDQSGNEDRTVRAEVSATPTASAPPTKPKTGEDDGPETVDPAVYQLIIALLLVAVSAMITFKVLFVARRPPESGTESRRHETDAEEEAQEEAEEDGYE